MTRTLRALAELPLVERLGLMLIQFVWLISAALGLTVIWGLFASTGLSAQLPDQPPAEITPIKELAERLGATLPGWSLHEQDEQTRVAVAGHRGFRLVLRRTWKEFTNINQSQVAVPQSEESAGPFELRHEDWEFVLIPIRPKAASEAIKSRIKWRKSASPYYTRDLCLGQGFGYVWFTHGTLFGQEFLRDRLKLEGGDDRLQLAMDGLQVQDVGTNTGNSCLYIPAKFGDRALPYIEKTIEQVREGDDLWRVVGSLAFIRTDRSTELLLKLFDSGNEELRRSAQYALIHKPYREAAKRAYLDMLKRQSSLESACLACVEFQWKDAVPILRDVIASPHELAGLRLAIPARRALEGLPISQELLDAERTLHALMRPDRDPELQLKIDSARRHLIQTDDSEGANLAALSLAIMTSKGNTMPVNEAGLEILKSRPRQSTVVFLKSLAAGVHEKDRPQVEKLLSAVENVPAPGEE